MSQTMQLDLFSSVLHAYAQPEDGTLHNQDLYRIAAQTAGVPEEEASRREAVGESGEAHNLFARRIRWYQQTLKASGILEKVDGARGVWRLTKPASKDLSRIEPNVSVVGFSTELGIAILGSCDSVFASIDAPVTLMVTSPPYPLASARKYGNPPEHLYVDWICRMLEPVVKNLVPGGSICLNISNDIFLTGSPERSLYCERLVLALHDRLGLRLMDRLIWQNKSKPPGPFQYASKARTQLNVEYEPIYWFTNDPHKVKSDNRRVLQAHSDKHLALIAAGGEQRKAKFSDGAYSLRPGSYGNATEGRIPRNILPYGHRCASQSAYKQAATAMGLPAHGAPMPLALASFLVEFLTEPGDLVADPFSGSFTTALAAERLGRRWLGTECMVEYVLGGATRFEAARGFVNRLVSSANLALRDEPELQLL
jgi:DNA modification methylase